GGLGGAEGAEHPVGTAPLPARRPREREPTPVDLVRLVRVDADVPVTVFRQGARDPDLLVPAMTAAHGIGLDGKRQVLMHAGLRPPDPARVGIGGVVRLDPAQLRQLPPTSLLLDIHEGGREAARPFPFREAPPAEVMRARDDTRADPLRHPDPIHEMADLRLDPDETARRDAETRGVGGVYP